MRDYIINVSEIESLQMINDVQELENIFQKAKSTIVCGATVQLGRKDNSGKINIFEKITILPDLTQYRNTVFKFLKTV